MSVDEILKRIEKEKSDVKRELYNAEGLLKLQETMAAYGGEYRLVWSTETSEKLKAKEKKPMHSTGIAPLDNLIGGFREQQLVSLFAHTKHGKTQFGVFITQRLKALNPVFIAMEQSAEEIIEQYEANGFGTPVFLHPENLALRRTVDWIEERVVEGIAKHNTRLVLIDHLGYIDDAGKEGEFRRENQAYRIEKVMQGLKNVAKKWNVIVFLLVHISQSDEGKPPSLADIKGSSSVAQESDTVLSLWRKNEVRKKVRVFSSDNLVMLSVQANRRTGRNGNIGLCFNGTNGQYEEKNGWVESMMKTAENAIAVDEDFDNA